jgi:hypothetical protein
MQARDWLIMACAGAVVGLAGAVGFFVAHGLLISPIWSSLPGGAAVAAAGGMAISWAFTEFRMAGRMRPKFLWGAAFGLLVWASLLPITLLDSLLRLTGWRDSLESAEVPIMLAVAAASGGAIGGVMTRRWRGSLAFACATVAAALLMGGPVPVSNSLTATGLFLSFLLVFVLACAVMASATCAMTRGASAASAGGATGA